VPAAPGSSGVAGSSGAAGTSGTAGTTGASAPATIPDGGTAAMQSPPQTLLSAILGKVRTLAAGQLSGAEAQLRALLAGGGLGAIERGELEALLGRLTAGATGATGATGASASRESSPTNPLISLLQKILHG
jgi:hypothetical protein